MTHIIMTLEEALKLLKEADEAAFKTVEKELETLKNKGQGVEVERKKAAEAEKALEALKTEHSKEIANYEGKIQAAKEEGRKDTDGFKKLYDEAKEALRVATENNSNNTQELENLKKAKADFEALVSADIEKLYIGLEEDDVKTLKSLAEKYPIQERVSFITDFKEKYLSGTKRQGGKPRGGSSSDITTMEDIKAEYDKLVAKPFKTPAEQAALRKASKYLSGELELPKS